MKRGIIMEVKKRKAIILTKDGSFEAIRIKKGTYPEIGEEIHVDPSENGSRKSPLWLPAVAAMAAVFIFIIFLGGFQQNETVAAYVSYDINPSFSVVVNDELEVLSLKTWNDDAEALFSNAEKFRHMSLKDFTDFAVRKFKQSGYLQGKPHLLIATTVVLEEDSEKASLQSHLQQTIRQMKTTLSERDSLSVTVKNADPQTRLKANRNGLSLGKYMLYMDAKEKGHFVALNQVKALSVSDLKQKIEGPVDVGTAVDLTVKVEPETTNTETEEERESEDTQQDTAIAKNTQSGNEHEQNNVSNNASNKDPGKLSQEKPDQPAASTQNSDITKKHDKNKGKKDKKDKKHNKKNDKHKGKKKDKEKHDKKNKKEEKKNKLDHYWENREDIEEFINRLIDDIYSNRDDIDLELIREFRN